MNIAEVVGKLYATIFLLIIILFPIWGPILGIWYYIKNNKKKKEQKEKEYLKSLKTSVSQTNPKYEDWKREQAERAKNEFTTEEPYRSNKPQIEIIYPKRTNDPTIEVTISEPYRSKKPQIEVIKQVFKQENNTATNKQKPSREIPYEPIPLLTWNEKQNYLTLREAADNKNLLICPKIRLADLIKPHNGKEYMSNFGRIKAKHVDFVICDREMNVKLIIELDDNSHYQKKRVERDQFVDEILKATGYTIIHTRAITPEILDNI